MDDKGLMALLLRVHVRDEAGFAILYIPEDDSSCLVNHEDKDRLRNRLRLRLRIRLRLRLRQRQRQRLRRRLR
jgi:hypothetical protein